MTSYEKLEDFDPDGIPPEDIEKLRRFVKLMQDLAKIGVL